VALPPWGKAERLLKRPAGCHGTAQGVAEDTIIAASKHALDARDGISAADGRAR
jgi:hypothetical protein